MVVTLPAATGADGLVWQPRDRPENSFVSSGYETNATGVGDCKVPLRVCVPSRGPLIWLGLLLAIEATEALANERQLNGCGTIG